MSREKVSYCCARTYPVCRRPLRQRNGQRGYIYIYILHAPCRCILDCFHHIIVKARHTTRAQSSPLQIKPVWRVVPSRCLACMQYMVQPTSAKALRTHSRLYQSQRTSRYGRSTLTLAWRNLTRQLSCSCSASCAKISPLKRVTQRCCAHLG